jgi:hypothetical protein
MINIEQYDSIAEVRSNAERIEFPKRSFSAMHAIERSGRIFGRVPMRSMTGNKHNLRETQPWHWQPATLREAETFRNTREDRGKHLTRFVSCATAPVVKAPSFYERNRNPYLK